MEKRDLLTTTFAGLKLANPIIAASCSLTGNTNSVKNIIDAGVGAVVLKSLFEEDIVRENDSMAQSAAQHTEAADYMQSYLSSHALTSYTTLIQECKAISGDTPIIASINCHTLGEWTSYAEAIERAGADALELNVMSIESSAGAEDGEVERRYIAIARSVCEVVQIPVILKLGAVVSNHVSLVARLMACGVKGCVMFNRLYQTDIDIDNMCYTRGAVLGSASDLSLPLRYIAITSAALPLASLALSGGAHSGECVVKALLSGASAVEVCSTLYQKSGDEIKAWVEASLSKVAQWQEEHGYSSVEEFVGAMNNSCDEHRDEIMRAQFLKYFGQYK